MIIGSVKEEQGALGFVDAHGCGKELLQPFGGERTPMTQSEMALPAETKKSA